MAPISYNFAIVFTILLLCTLARVGLISPAARDAARRRQVAMRLEEEMRKERRSQWMASLHGPGWARRGNCHSLVQMKFFVVSVIFWNLPRTLPFLRLYIYFCCRSFSNWRVFINKCLKHIKYLYKSNQIFFLILVQSWSGENFKSLAQVLGLVRFEVEP